jgi:hypothetical protein
VKLFSSLKILPSCQVRCEYENLRISKHKILFSFSSFCKPDQIENRITFNFFSLVIFSII